MTSLRLEPSVGPLSPPPERGRLLTPGEVATMIGRSPAWCRRYVPHKVRLGHSTVKWYELDVRAWLEAQREG